MQFTLTGKTNSVCAVCDIGAAEQIAAALSSDVSRIRQYRAAKEQSNALIVAAEELFAIGVSLDPWADKILLRAVMKTGIAHTFAIPREKAAEIAERLKTESTKPKQAPGSA